MVSEFSPWWSRRSHTLGPRGDMLRRYVGNLWRLSEYRLEAGVDSSEFWVTLNQGKMAFGGEAEVVSLLDELSKEGGPLPRAYTAVPFSLSWCLIVREKKRGKT